MAMSTPRIISRIPFVMCWANTPCRMALPSGLPVNPLKRTKPPIMITIPPISISMEWEKALSSSFAEDFPGAIEEFCDAGGVAGAGFCAARMGVRMVSSLAQPVMPVCQ